MDCSTCEHKKGMINKRRGVKIPGQSGKCTRKGGLCGRFLIGMVQGGTPQAEIMAAFGFKNSSAMRVAYANALMAEPRLKENQQKKDVDMKSSLTTSTEPLVPEVVDDVRVGPLNDEEKKMKTQCDQDIRVNMASAFKFGAAILILGQYQLFRETHDTLYEYMRDNFDIEKSRVHQLMNASKVYQNLHNCGVLIMPANEAQSRPLTRPGLEETDQVAVWKSVVETAPGGNITAKMVSKAVDEYLGTQKKQRAKTIRDDAGKDPSLPQDLQEFVADLVERARIIEDKDQRSALRKYLEGVLNLLQD